MGGEGATNVSPRWRLEPISSHVGVFFLICFKLLTFSVNKSHVSLSVMLNLIAHTALYTGCFFYCSHLVDCWLPPRKVISMELVPPNRKNDLSTLVPPETQKITEFFQLLKTLSSFVLWVGPVYLVIFLCGLCGTSVLTNFFCWGGQFHT